MNIKKYIHLYYGQECRYDVNPCFPEHGDVDSGFLRGVEEGHITHAWPVLRPLSDMTLQETKELVGIQEMFLSNVHIQDRMQRMAAAETAYLLSRGFDLFGLIDAELAIDKTKTGKQ